MKEKLNEEQIQLLTDMGIDVETIDDMDMADLEEQVGDYLQNYGIDDDDNVNAEGRICESILDLID